MSKKSAKSRRRLTKRAHALFDEIWENGSLSRRESYHWLSTRLSLPLEKTHFGCMSSAELEHAIWVIRSEKRAAKAASSFLSTLSHQSSPTG